jgi:hypothetical protein
MERTTSDVAPRKHCAFRIASGPNEWTICDFPGASRCEEHSKLVCASCGKKPVRECNHRSPEGICKEPLCYDCDHVPTGEKIFVGQPIHQCRTKITQRIVYVASHPNELPGP